MRGIGAYFGVFFMVWCAGQAAAQWDEAPAIPWGLDAYRQWAKWPVQRIGVRSYMRSTYDRSGGNEGADAGHFLYQERDDFNVTLDIAGSGVLCFVRYNHWHGSPWFYEVDGVCHKIWESSTADPEHPAENSVFFPEGLFPHPLVWTWSETKGADLSWVPIPFTTSFRMAYGRTRYGTGYYIYQQYLPDARLSQPLTAWDGKTPPARDVIDLINRTGTDIAPVDIDTETGTIALGRKESATLFRYSGGPRTIRALKISVPRALAVDFGRTRLRITWDGRPEPSVDAPVCLFFGAGALYNRDDREFLVKAFPVNIRFDADRVYLACYFPMPFHDSAHIAFSGLNPTWKGKLGYEIRHEPYTGPKGESGYLHATYRDHPEPIPGHDLVLLDTQGAEGETDWSGSFIGTSFIFSHSAVLNTLEGDPRFFFDDCRTPSYGTGTEEWGGGGDYWGGRTMSLPFAGHPCGARNQKAARHPEDLIESAYRFLLADLMPFGRRAVIQLEHGGDNLSKEHYETVTYWYGWPAATLVMSDEFDVGDADSERAHGYSSPQASEPQTIVSRYEWGPDHIKSREGQNSLGTEPIEIFPAHDEAERHTTGSSEFMLAIRPDNCGVLLRRTLDYSLPNQRAVVYVADASRIHATDDPAWECAGIWYTAGSNTCYYSNPPGELDDPDPIVQTSNRRFRDDEFLLARRFTERRFALHIRIEFQPVRRPLLPGLSVPDSAWSEIRYQAHCFLPPAADP